MKKIIILFTVISWTSLSYSADTILPPNRDEYLTGYIQSIFVFSYGLPADAVRVENSIITIQKKMLGDNNANDILEKTKNATANLKGINGYILSEQNSYAPSVINNQERIKTSAQRAKYTDIAMPSHSLFQPLIADPKWPRFTLAYQYYLKDGHLKHAFAPNFGASFPLYRIVNNQKDSEWELGVQGGLFGIMDIGRNPTALVNADYFIGIPLTYSSGLWSGLARLYHVSSHLGDEFMLSKEGKKTQRINLSYEGLDILLSHNFNELRLYGGGGYIIHKEPSYVKPLKFQAGAEYYALNTYVNGRFRPIMGIDIKLEEQGRWYPGISCKAGVQLENSALINSKVQLMLEFYSGKSIHGQFYRDKVTYVGIGIQAFL